MNAQDQDFDFDLVTIGAGSGGVAASRRAALHGARVAVVEGSRVGGTCVIRGCVPKKLLMYAAQLGDALREAPGYGWDITPPRFEMARWAASKAAEIDRLEAIYRGMLATSGVVLIEGWAAFDGAHGSGHRVRIAGAGGERVVSARHVLVASGAAPVRDSIPGIEVCPTSDDLLDLAALPANAAVIGGGYIAVEFASMLARLGVAVTLHYRDRLPLRGFDEMLRVAAAAELQAAGVELQPGHAPLRVQHVDGANNGTSSGTSGGTSGGSYLLSFTGDRVRDFAWVLNATGRRPNTAGLKLDSVGIAVGPNAALPVDAALRTTVPGIHAIGDVTDRINLTPVAIAHGRAWADSLFGPVRNAVDLSLVSSAVFMLPPLASIGPSEAQAIADGHALKVYETDFRPMKQAFIGGTERTRLKLLVDARTDRVLAVHMAGADAPEIVQSLAVALSAKATKADFDRTIAMHPTAAEEFMLMREPARTIAAQARTNVS